jgi:hypothetical protein
MMSEIFYASTSVSQPVVYAPVIIRLLQGVVYSDDEIWSLLSKYTDAVQAYFAQIGLELYFNDMDGFAYVMQPEIESESGAKIVLPRLTRRRLLTYTVTILLVILREELNQFDTQDVDNHRLILSREYLIERMQPFYPHSDDERKKLRDMERDLNQVVEFGFLKLLKTANGIEYVVRPVLKAKIHSDELETIKAQLMKYAGSTQDEQHD